MQPLHLNALSPEQLGELDVLYHSTKSIRVRTRAQMVLLAAEQGLIAPQIAAIVRSDEDTVRRWIKRFQAEGVNGLEDRPRPGGEPKVTPAYRTRLLEAVRRRPRSLGLPFSLWTLQRLADFLAEETGVRLSDETVRRSLKANGIVMSRPQHTISSPDPEYLVKKTRDHLKPGEVFYYADEFNLSWQPTLRSMWSPLGQQVMIPTPGQPAKRYGLGAVNYHTGESVVLVRRHKRRREVAELLEALLAKHPHETIHVAWDNANTHEEDEVEAVLRGAAGRLVLLYLPTDSPWWNPIEMLGRHFRREVTHCELFVSMHALIDACMDFFRRCNEVPERVLSIIGAHPAISL
jgi:transposase